MEGYLYFEKDKIVYGSDLTETIAKKLPSNLILVCDQNKYACFDNLNILLTYIAGRLKEYDKYDKYYFSYGTKYISIECNNGKLVKDKFQMKIYGSVDPKILLELIGPKNIDFEPRHMKDEDIFNAPEIKYQKIVLPSRKLSNDELIHVLSYFKPIDILYSNLFHPEDKIWCYLLSKFYNVKQEENCFDSFRINTGVLKYKIPMYYPRENIFVDKIYPYNLVVYFNEDTYEYYFTSQKGMDINWFVTKESQKDFEESWETEIETLHIDNNTYLYFGYNCGDDKGQFYGRIKSLYLY